MENPFEIILEKLSHIEKAIEKLNSPSKTDDELMNVDQVARFINSTKSSVYGLTHARKIPYYKTAGKLIFKKSEIMAMIDSTKVKTKQEQNAEINKMADEYLLRGMFKKK